MKSGIDVNTDGNELEDDSIIEATDVIVINGFIGAEKLQQSQEGTHGVSARDKRDKMAHPIVEKKKKASLQGPQIRINEQTKEQINILKLLTGNKFDYQMAALLVDCFVKNDLDDLQLEEYKRYMQLIARISHDRNSE